MLSQSKVKMDQRLVPVYYYMIEGPEELAFINWCSEQEVKWWISAILKTLREEGGLDGCDDSYALLSTPRHRHQTGSGSTKGPSFCYRLVQLAWRWTRERLFRGPPNEELY